MKTDPDQDVPTVSPAIQYNDWSQIQFTSGSTGQPKGVIYSNRVMARSLAIKNNREEHGPDRRHGFITLFSFGSPITTILASIYSGGELILYDFRRQGLNDLKHWINGEGITNFKFTGTVFRQFLENLTSSDFFPTLRSIRIGGEKVYPTDIATIRKYLPPECKLNLGLSTTETLNISTAVYRFDQLPDWELVPVGFPNEGVNVYIWDKNERPVKYGEAGEIVVEGDALALGYLNQPELTKEKFLPGVTDPVLRLYKTGDLGRFLPDGSLLHLGRIDHQLKIRGVRIEPAGIENHLLSFPGVKNAVVTDWTTPRGEKKLVAYVQAADQSGGFASQLREYVRANVPGTMLPSYYVILKDFPLTQAGKLDRNSLPDPDLSRPTLPYRYVAPEDDIEQRVAKVWERTLGIRGIGVHDRFFDLGGDSLTAAVLFIEFENEFNLKLPLSTLMKAETVRAHSAILKNVGYLANWSPVVPIQTTGDLTPVFCFAGKGGNPLRFRALAELIGPQHPIYFMQSRGLDGRGRPFNRIPEIAADFIHEMRRHHPSGPVHLIGSSFGGLVAFEIASRLALEEVGVVALLDTFAPQSLSQARARRSRLSKQLEFAGKHFRLAFLSGTRARREYLRYYKDYLPTVLTQKIRGADRIFGRKSPTGQVPPELKRVEQANISAARHYVPPAYGGKVLLIKANNQGKGTDKGPTLGWDPAKIGDLEICTVNGNHGDILFYPAVSEVYKILSVRLGQ